MKSVFAWKNREMEKCQATRHKCHPRSCSNWVATAAEGVGHTKWVEAIRTRCDTIRYDTTWLGSRNWAYKIRPSVTCAPGKLTVYITKCLTYTRKNIYWILTDKSRLFVVLQDFKDSLFTKNILISIIMILKLLIFQNLILLIKTLHLGYYLLRWKSTSIKTSMFPNLFFTFNKEISSKYMAKE